MISSSCLLKYNKMSNFLKKISDTHYMRDRNTNPTRPTNRRKNSEDKRYSPIYQKQIVPHQFEEDQIGISAENVSSYQRSTGRHRYADQRRDQNPQHSYSGEFVSTKNKDLDYSCHVSQEGQTEIENRFREIETLFGRQNGNLKEHNEYLLGVIEKMKEREKKYKNQIQSYKAKMETLEEENETLKQKYEQAREVLSTGIGQIQQAVRNQQNFKQLTPILPNNVHGDTAASLNISDSIQELSEKFDVLMYEYQKTKDPQIRKQCMQIAKQLKKLKKSNGVAIRHPIQ